MVKKLIMPCMAVAAFAAFVPATASATNDPQLTEGVSLVPTQATIVGTATNTLFTNTEGTSTLVTCSKAQLTGALKVNHVSTVEVEVPKGSAIFEGTGAKHAHNNLPECTGSFGNAYITVTSALCVRSDATMATDEFQATGCGANKVKFTIGSTTLGTCEYEATGAVKGTYTTNGSEAQMTTINNSAGSGAKLTNGVFFCPTSGSLGMTFSLETTNGTKLTIS